MYDLPPCGLPPRSSEDGVAMVRTTRIIKIGSVEIKAALLKLLASVCCNINPPWTTWCLFLPQTSPRLFFLVRTTDLIDSLNEERCDLTRPALVLRKLVICLSAFTLLANLHKQFLYGMFFIKTTFTNCLPDDEPMRLETCRRRQKPNESINLNSVHFVGLCCISLNSYCFVKINFSSSIWQAYPHCYQRSSYNAQRINPRKVSNSNSLNVNILRARICYNMLGSNAGVSVVFREATCLTRRKLRSRSSDNTRNIYYMLPLSTVCT